MVSPVPKHLRTPEEIEAVDRPLRLHVCDLRVNPSHGVKIPGANVHRARYAPGLATELAKLANSESIGDPMAGVGTFAHETGLTMALNDIDGAMARFHEPLKDRGCETSYVPAHEIEWTRDVCVFSPPYYPRTDRRKPCAHDDAKRGPVVGFRDSYSCDHPEFIGNPGGVNAILEYRRQMARVYGHLASVCNRMVVVTKNWTRLGVEMRLDLDTILIAQDVGWECVSRHGWTPTPSLWARFNAARGGGVPIEDVLVFRKRAVASRAEAA